MTRLRTFGWFLLTLFFVWRLLFPGSPGGAELSLPTSEDRRSAGLAGLSEWLQRSNVPVHSQRLRFTELPPEIEASRGNLAILHLPAQVLYQAEEVQALLDWVAQGNTLLIAAGYLEGSPWIYGMDNVSIHHSFWRLTGLAAVPTVMEDEAAEPTETAGEPGADESGADDGSWQETLSEVADEAQASVSDALTLPGWLQVHGAKRPVVLESAMPHPLVDNLDELEVPWDDAAWSLLLPVEQARRLELTDEREVAVQAVRERYRQTSADTDGSANDVQPQQPDADTDTDAEVEDELSPLEREMKELNDRYNARSLLYPDWRDDLEACDAEADDSVRQLSGKQGCLPLPTVPGEDWQVLLRHADSEQIVLLNAPLDAGQMLVLWQPALLDNEVIHRFGNRQFAASLIDQYLSDTGTVVFDDAHQGLNRIVDADTLLTDRRLYITVGFLLLFWVAYLLADAGQWARATLRPAPVSVGQRDLIDANANFLANRLSPFATYELQLLPLKDYLARKWRLSADDALQSGLRLEHSNNAAAVDALSHLLERITRGQKVAPGMLQEAIERLLPK